ncbi:MAG: hypothetical protein ABI361_14070 [Nitrososphaera sp.]|jgi:hypothetical protein
MAACSRPDANEDNIRVIARQGSASEAAGDIRAALNEALKMFGEYSRLAAWRQLEQDFRISLTGTKPISRREVEVALQHIFGSGAWTVLRSLDQELSRTAARRESG